MERFTGLNNTTTKPIIGPICHMKVDLSKTDLEVIHKGQNYYFCSEACQKAFEKNPQKHLEPKRTKFKGPKGWWGRYMERVAKSNRKLLGGNSAGCQC